VTVHGLVVGVLIALGVAGELLCCFALVVFRNVFDRLHYAMASSTLPPVLVAAAVVVEEGWNVSSVNTLAAAAFLFVLNPVAAIAAGRAARAAEAPE
jgi:monovalent cation/proton antiporter MnhG/PhaG subunit